MATYDLTTSTPTSIKAGDILNIPTLEELSLLN
jgi:hypothetical protein